MNGKKREHKYENCQTGDKHAMTIVDRGQQTGKILENTYTKKKSQKGKWLKINNRKADVRMNRCEGLNADISLET